MKYYQLTVTFIDGIKKEYYTLDKCGVFKLYENLEMNGDVLMISATDLYDLAHELEKIIQGVKIIVPKMRWGYNA